MTVAGGGLIPGPLRPKLAFTGTSILTFDGKGKICKHVDTWVRCFVFSPSSSLDNQKNKPKPHSLLFPPPPLSSSPFLFDSYHIFSKPAGRSRRGQRAGVLLGRRASGTSCRSWPTSASRRPSPRPPPPRPSGRRPGSCSGRPRTTRSGGTTTLSAIEAPMGGGEGAG